jgi:formylglycine-generating enzyme required for sulfatase activity
MGQPPRAVPVAPVSAKEMKPYTETIPGTETKFDLVPIPGGTFMMGSPESENGHKPDEGPPHPVEIRPFWMGKCEVTWDEFDIYANSMNIRAKDSKPGEAPPSDVDGVTRPTPPYTDMTFGYGRKGYPTICMSHHAAMEYCRWLSGKTGKHYRLPTEAEWEYACRAGTTTAYHFGNDPGRIGDYAWYVENADIKSQPVGKKKPNPWGLHDMHGNVAEWVLDHYAKDYYQSFSLQVPTRTPVSIPTEKKFPHVVRGGSWIHEPADLRSAVRLPSTKDWLRQDPQRPQSIWWLTDADFVGFRVVRPLEEQENLKGLKSKVVKD